MFDILTILPLCKLLYLGLNKVTYLLLLRVKICDDESSDVLIGLVLASCFAWVLEFHDLTKFSLLEICNVDANGQVGQSCEKLADL